MGGENSRPSPGANIYSSPHHHPAWSQIACVPLQQWKAVSNPVYAIDYYSEWKNRQLKVHKRPWSRFAVHGKNPGSGKEEKLCSFTCQVFETGREEKFRGWIKDNSVIALQQNVAVVQVVLPKAVKLLVVNWPDDKLLGTYTFTFSKEPCIQECYLSPDATLMLCRQNFWLRRKLGHITSFDPNIRVIQIKDGLCRRLFVIEDSVIYSVFGSGISLDPRYSSGRAVIFTSSLQMSGSPPTADNNQAPPNIQVFNLQKRQLISAAVSSVDSVVHHIKHSPDGTLIAALLVNVSIYISCTLRAHEIQVYHSDSLISLHSVSLFDHVTKSHVLDVFPVFSRDVGVMAQATGESVCIMRLPQRAHSLQEACRYVIRRHTKLSQVDKLPLPKSVVGFLQFAIKEV